MELYILKLGGSVVTRKDRQGAEIREALLKKVAKRLKQEIGRKKFNLILIHGAGSTGHQLAHKYQLSKGANQTKDGWIGSLVCRIANQKMDIAIAEIMVKAGLRTVSIHTAGAIIQKNKALNRFDLTMIREALDQDCIPMLYGEMVFDKKLGMTVCSGDVIAPYLAKKLGAKKVFYASDIDGIFDRDPYHDKKARLIKKISLNKIERDIQLSGSHNIDVTGGLSGKIKKLEPLKGSRIRSIEIFNGLKEENYSKIFSGRTFPHTTITT